MGIFARNRPKWTILDVACILYGYCTIPIYDTLGDENISYVFNHTKLLCLKVMDKLNLVVLHLSPMSLEYVASEKVEERYMDYNGVR